MDYAAIIRQLASVISEILGQRGAIPVTADSDLVEDLGFDSIMAIRLMMEFEEVFGINIVERSEEIRFAEIKTVGDVARLVERLSE